MGGDLPRPAGGQGADLPGLCAARPGSAPTSTASRSSRAGSTPTATRRRRSTTSPGPATAKPGADGKLPPVGNTVDVENATWTNTIGARAGTVWTDPDFDPAQRAFYYARVIEIPTPRWTAYDAFRFGVEMSRGRAAMHQERAYTSPIWYTPYLQRNTRSASRSRRGLSFQQVYLNPDRHPQLEADATRLLEQLRAAPTRRAR
jgi:hypothetical protein